jgi:prophage regulatory protein
MHGVQDIDLAKLDGLREGYWRILGRNPIGLLTMTLRQLKSVTTQFQSTGTAVASESSMKSAATADQQSIQILRLPAVCQVTGLSRSMIYQLEAQRGFPARVRIAARAVGWIEREVQSWLAERVSRSRDEAV